MSSGSEKGRRPEKSRFSLTCKLFSQYIKEKGCPADLGLGISSRSPGSYAIGKIEAYHPPTTMSLLPGVAVAGNDLDGPKDDTLARNADKSMEVFSYVAPSGSKEPEKAQLTIFYSGKVLVFDKFPAEKAKDLMQIASNSCAASGGQPVSISTATAVTSTFPELANFPATFSPQPQPKFSDLPIARKASLHRFLEKRKDRINAKAPYQLSSSVGSKDAVSLKEEEIIQPWLGLGPQISKPGMTSDCS